MTTQQITDLVCYGSIIVIFAILAISLMGFLICEMIQLSRIIRREIMKIQISDAWVKDEGYKDKITIKVRVPKRLSKKEKEAFKDGATECVAELLNALQPRSRPKIKTGFEYYSGRRPDYEDSIAGEKTQ